MDLSWTPDFFHVVRSDDNYVNGYVASEIELNSLLEIHRRTYSCSFVVRSDDKKKKKAGSRRTFWEHKPIGVCQKTDDDGIIYPFEMDNVEIRYCQFGPPHTRNNDERIQVSEPEHNYPRRRKTHLQPSRKVGCTAKVHIHRLTRYDSYGASKQAGRRERELVLSRLVEDNKDVSHPIHVCLPLPGAHDKHTLSKEGGFCSRIDKQVKEKLTSLVMSGITSTPVVKKLLKTYVHEEMNHPDNVLPSSSDRAFFPRNSTVSNHINKVLAAGKYSDLDQDHLEDKIVEWQSKNPSDKYFLRKCTEKVDTVPHSENADPSDSQEDCDYNFLFIHQSKDQQTLLKRYGKLVLLDATYKTTKYALPLFMLAVSTNFSYLPVAEFIVQSETSSSIVEALEIIKGWNPEWSPDHFMVDYSEEEYQALQAVFPTAEKFLCAFHREQSWKRWVKNSKNGLSDEQQNMFLEMMRNVASSTHVGLAVEEVKRSRLYTENSKVRQYLDRYWLNCVQRWCDVYVKHSPSTIIPVTTTNGIEALNKSVKHSYLKLKSNGTLSTMVEILVEEFVPDIILEYRNLNYMACSQYKSYRPEIPDFLHNRPHKIVKALMKSMASADYSLPRHVHELSTTSFEVLSEDREDVWYEVKLDEPSCKCPYFKQQRLPCKHIFAILKHTDKNWEDLNEMKNIGKAHILHWTPTSWMSIC